MGKCISKPVAVDPPAEKPKTDSHPGESTPAAATPAKGSDRSLQQLFAKDEEREDEEENGQLKRIPEEDSSAEEQEEETTDKAAAAVEGGVVLLETIAEDSSKEEGSGNAGGVIAPAEIEKQELDPTSADEEGTGAVKGGEAPPQKVEHVEEERPSTPEISESNKSPPADASPAPANKEEVVSVAPPADSGSEQVDEKQVDLITQESDKFELVLKPQESEKFEIEIFGGEGAVGSGQGRVVEEKTSTSKGAEEEEAVASKKEAVQDEAEKDVVIPPGMEEAGSEVVALPGKDEAGNEEVGVPLGQDEEAGPAHDKDIVPPGKDERKEEVVPPGKNEAENDEATAQGGNEAAVAVPHGKNEAENDEAAEAGNEAIAVPHGKNEVENDEAAAEAGNEAVPGGNNGKDENSESIEPVGDSGGDTDILQKVENNVDTNETGASKPRSTADAAEGSNKASSEKVDFGALDPDEARNAQSKEESGQGEPARDQAAAADVSLDAGELHVEPSPDVDTSVNASTAAQGQEEVKPEEFFEASEQISDLPESMEQKAAPEVEAAATPVRQEDTVSNT
ncbi:hypothetical protein SELMODRAFT_442335 [Selaginella moellendorffii]|uniref:Uncharacterized protein n=1 Tax=Selaginella moellendorffii TaxID=88036 RepID=D8RSM7_SELML|nr:FK506-binding protein 5 [Selaginella moellendorffii]EFJ25098.1 hypothetical protein SELMODRAFT_442335 [Selaginella moellendorffii]|eukprot:XP_002974143.1 FK506-binding protein 5 [Selaginella moellendorffii]